MSDDEVVASVLPPRYLICELFANVGDNQVPSRWHITGKEVERGF